jgi:hypothetical protein
MIAKNTICSTSFAAAASKKLWGTVCSSTPDNVVFRAANCDPRFGRSRAEVHANTRLRDVHGDQADGQRDRGDDLEVDDRAECEPPDFLQVVAVARDANHQCREEQRHDQRLDHPQEDRRQDLEVRRRPVAVLRPLRLREEVPDGDAKHHRDQDPLRRRDAAQSGAWCA